MSGSTGMVDRDDKTEGADSKRIVKSSSDTPERLPIARPAPPHLSTPLCAAVVEFGDGARASKRKKDAARPDVKADTTPMLVGSEVRMWIFLMRT